MIGAGEARHDKLAFQLLALGQAGCVAWWRWWHCVAGGHAFEGCQCACLVHDVRSDLLRHRALHCTVYMERARAALGRMSLKVILYNAMIPVVQCTMLYFMTLQ